MRFIYDSFKDEFNKQPPYDWPLSEDLETTFFDYEEPTPIEDAFLADRDSTSLKPDLLIISGIINYKNLRNIKREYANLVGRKYVVVIGNSDATTRHLNSYNIVNNIQEHIPVDLFIHGSSNV